MRKQLCLFIFLLSAIHICKGDQGPLEGDLFLPTRDDLVAPSTSGIVENVNNVPGTAPILPGKSRYNADGLSIIDGDGSVTETTTTSWFDDLANSFTGVLFGILMIVFGLPLLWFNERHSVETEKVIKEGLRICKETSENNLDSNLNGQLVHVSAQANNPKIISDKKFGITAENSARLNRRVEVYQLKELKSSTTTKNQIGGGSTTTSNYTYEHIWSETKIDSFNFKNEAHKAANNNVKLIFSSHTFDAEEVNVGQFKLRPTQISRLNNFQRIQLNSNSAILSKEAKEELNKAGWSNYVVSIDENYLYIKKNHNTTEIGDIRISFQRVPLEWITVVALQNGRSLEPYNIKEQGLKEGKGDEEAGYCSGIGDSLDSCCWTYCCCIKCMSSLLATQETIDWIYEKKMTKKEVFDSELKSNTFITILLRILGFFLISFGIYLLFSPIIALLSIIKILGDIVSFAVLLASMLIGFALSLLIVGIAWVFYRPLLALALVAIGGLIWGFVYFAGGDDKLD